MPKLLTRRETAQYLQDRGLPGTAASLAKLATVGGGPKISYFGTRVRYDQSDIDAYIASRLRKATSTSDRSGTVTMELGR